MLRGIAPCISPDLLATLARMGHGDELVLCDAHFPADSVNARVLRADGVSLVDLLDGILPLLVLDTYASPLLTMAAEPGDSLDPAVEVSYLEAVRRHPTPGLGDPTFERLPRQAFYDRAAAASAVVVTGQVAKYGNLILKKGVTPVARTGESGAHATAEP